MRKRMSKHKTKDPFNILPTYGTRFTAFTFAYMTQTIAGGNKNGSNEHPIIPQRTSRK